MPAFGTTRRALKPGHRLDGRYELLLPYAQGGMATVWLARVQGKHGFEKLFAVKTILPHLAADTAFRNMFLDEARIASRIRHGNVAEIEDLGEDEGHLYMVLEWIQGDAWSKLAAAIVERGDPTPADLMLRIAASACAGLHAAHELVDDFGRSLNVVHRDVSPQNVMITEGGVVKVIDFGVAKAIGRASEQTRTGLIKGKLEYLAPELALGRQVDRRADVWAIGAALYHLFTGRAPFTGRNDLEVLKRITSGAHPAPLPSTVPQPVADVVMQCLELDLARRVPTALDLQRRLESVMTSHVSPEDVAGALRRYLKPRIQARHESIAEALREAAARAAAPGVPRSPSQAELPPMRATFPTLPPEAAPVPSQSGLSMPAPAPTDVDVGAPASIRARTVTEPPAPRLRALHAVWIALATLVTLGVWSAVVARALRPATDLPSPHLHEPTPPASSVTLLSETGAAHGRLH